MRRYFFGEHFDVYWALERRIESLTSTTVKLKGRQNHALCHNCDRKILSTSRNEAGLPTTGFETGTSVDRLRQESVIRK